MLLDRPGLDEFRGRFSESPDPRQWPHVASGVTYRRAVRELGAFLGCEPVEAAVYVLLVDDGYPPPGSGASWQELGGLADCEARPVLRIERVAAESGAEGVPGAVAAAREGEFVGLKTIAAYRTGLELERIEPFVLAAL